MELATRVSQRQAQRHDRPGEHHWQSWVLRGLLLAVVGVQLANANRQGAAVAGEGFVLTLVPMLVTRLSGWHVPRMLEATYVLAVALQFVSESFKLFELLTYWDKLVHPGEIFLATGVATFLLLGYRDRHRLEMPDTMAATGALLFGITLGGLWEFVEFAADWFGNANLQKSNADTMTDLFTNDIGATFGMLLAFWLYVHRADEAQRTAVGAIAEWLTARVAHVLQRHGVTVGLAVAALAAAIMAAGWLVDRGPTPEPPPAMGESATWTFGPEASANAGALLGYWTGSERGVCRTNPDHPHPGSEEMGLLALAPGASYGAQSGFSLASRSLLERPPLGSGTAMAAGLAFGIRDPQNFYLLEVDATHDALRLERYVHGRQRDQRERRLRTRGDEWHDVQVDVRGPRARAVVDGQPVFEEGGLVETDGGIGLWARVTSAACFSEARVVVGGPAALGRIQPPLPAALLPLPLASA